MSIEQGPHGPSVINKVYWNTLPLLCTVAGLCYIDRTNLAFASFSLTKDLHFSPSVYGTGSGLFFAGYSLAMIPSQLLGLRLGVSRWLGIIVTLWGLVAACFSTIKTVHQFYTLRFLLGVAEAGAFPAIWYYLYSLLPKEALTIPYSALEAAVSTANVMSAPLAAALLLLDSKGGLKGWQWLFFIEGLFTLVVGLATGLLLPSGLSQASYLNSAERRWIQQQQGRTWQVQAKDDAEVFSDLRIIREAFGNWKVWFVSIMGIFKTVAGNAMLFWLPIIVASLLGKESGSFNAAAPSTDNDAILSQALAVVGAHNSSSSNSDPIVILSAQEPTPGISLPVLLSSIPFLCTAIFAIFLGRSSQAKGERAMHLTIPYVMAGVLFTSLAFLKTVSGVAAFIALTVAIACTMGSNCISNAYIPAVSSPNSVSVAMALSNSVSNLGGILGPWVMGELVEYTGNYDLACMLLGLVMAIAAAMAWSTRGWEAPPKSPSKLEPAIINSRSVGTSGICPCLMRGCDAVHLPTHRQQLSNRTPASRAAELEGVVWTRTATQ